MLTSVAIMRAAFVTSVKNKILIGIIKQIFGLHYFKFQRVLTPTSSLVFEAFKLMALSDNFLALICATSILYGCMQFNKENGDSTRTYKEKIDLSANNKCWI